MDENKRIEPVDYAVNTRRITLVSSIVVSVQVIIVGARYIFEPHREYSILFLALLGFCGGVLYAHRLAGKGKVTQAATLLLGCAAVLHLVAQLYMQDTIQEWIQRGALLSMLGAAILMVPPARLGAVCVAVIAAHTMISLVDIVVPSLDSGYDPVTRIGAQVVLAALTVALVVRIYRLFPRLPMLSKLTATMIAIVLIPTIATSATYSSWLSSRLLEHEESRLESLMDRLNGKLGGFFAEYEEFGRQTSRDPVIVATLQGDIPWELGVEQELATLVQGDKRDLAAVVLLDGDGMVMARSGVEVNPTYEAQWKNQTERGELDAMWVSPQKDDGYAHTVHFTPILGASGIIGWFGAYIDTEFLIRELNWLQDLWDAEHAEYVVVDESDFPIAKSDGLALRMALPGEVATALASPGVIPAFMTPTMDTYMARAMELPMLGWRLAVARPSLVVLEPVFEQVHAATFATSIYAVFAIVLAIALAHVINQPLSNLRRTAAAWRGGDLTERADTSRADEMGQLAVTFNEITSQLQQSLFGLRGQLDELATAHDDVRRKETHLQRLYDAAPIGMAIVDLEGRVSDANPALCSWLGYSLEELSGKSTADVSDKESMRMIHDAGNELLDGRETTAKVRRHYYPKGGGHLYGDVTLSLVKDGNGEPAYFIAQIVDVTSEVEHAERIAQRDADLRRRQAEREQIISISPIPISLLNPENGTIIDANEAYVELAGYEREEIIGTSTRMFAYDDASWRLGMERGARIVRGESEVERFDYRAKNRRGEIIELDMVGTLLRDEQGEPLYLIMQGLDVTEVRKHQRLLERSEANLRQRQQERDLIIQQAPIAVALLNPDDAAILEMNDSYCALLGYSREELTGIGSQDFAYDEEAKEAGDKAGHRLFHGKSDREQYDFRARTKDGRCVEVIVVQNMVRTDDGEPLYFIVQCLDMTQERLRERLLAERQEERRLVFDHAPYGMALLDADTAEFIDVNNKYCETTGYTKEDLVGLNVREITHAESWDEVYQAGHRLFHGHSSFESFEQTINRKDGELRNWRVALSLIHDEDGAPKHYISQIVDVTVEREAQLRIQQSEERLRLIAENTHDMIWLLDGDGVFIYVTPSCEIFHGVESAELIGASAVDWIHPDDIGQIIGEDGDFLELDLPRPYRCLNRKGEPVDAEFKATVIRDPETGRTARIIGTSRDVRDKIAAEQERRELERQIQHSQKLESLGLMAGGIAHDFNNLLVAILGHSNIAQLELERDSPVRDHLQNIENASLRASELTKQLLAYSGRGRLTSEYIDLGALVKDMVSLLDVSVSKQVKLRYELDRDVAAVQGDPGQIQQIVLNLITNASEAIGDEEGEISVTTGARVVHEDELLHLQFGEGCMPGRYATLVVRDSGKGMDAQTLERMFDPFFTTKSTGRGLGLAAIIGIVRSHSGAVDVQSESGRGTSFTILLPAVESRRAQERDAVPLATPEAESSNGVVLVVDDEALVRDTAKVILERVGFSVVTAENGKDALEYFAEAPDKVNAVVLDLTMPVMNGADAYAAMRAIDPNVRVLITSGFDESDAISKFADSPPFGFLQKPYRPTALAEEIGRMVRG